MPEERTNHTAREKLCAISQVYAHELTVSEACDQMLISRQTWYKWEKQLKDSIQQVWGGLARPHSDA